MLFLSDYQSLNKIYEGRNSLVYRGIRKSDEQKVIIKILNKEFPTNAELQNYKDEYKITKSLDLEGVVEVYSLDKYQNSLAIVLEDFGGDSLKILLQKHSFSLSEFLEIAIKIVTYLAEIHKNNIIHKDLNSANIVYNLETKQLKIIDFGISTRLTQENHSNSNILEGRLPYISPEQTGRVHLNVDYRTDFYSLGITFYELLTGELPFATEDVLELIHCHLSKSAIAPNLIDSSIPLTISNLVMKLMEKNPNHRYQSAWGIKTDLEKCLTQLQTTGVINNFDLASGDIADKFIISQKLYGRDHLISLFSSQWRNIHRQEDIAMTLISGYSGSGKSSLIKTIFKKNPLQKKYFISGKFDQFQSNIPYTAFIAAFKQLVKYKLKESPEKLSVWKTEILAKIGDNGQLIIDVIPEIELIIGKQLPLTELAAEEAQVRFNLIFQKFMEICATKENPLVIFLDDLQWADIATIKLIELMMIDSNLKYLSVIGAYRHNEIEQNHPLTMMINKVKSAGKVVQEFYLDNLSLDDVNCLIADTLHSDIDIVKPLGELVFNKTRGNPFFTQQFLNTLHIKKLIYFDYQKHQWQWHLKKIVNLKITDNVVDLIINQIRYLSKSIQKTLKISACLGNNFNSSSLCVLEKKAPEKIEHNLAIATNFGLILPLSKTTQISQYQFIHDKIQKGIYNLIPAHKKPNIHFKIAKLLLQKYTSQERNENLFELVRHLNLGKSLIKHKIAKKSLVKLNLKAGNRAKKAHAYSAAVTYLQTALEFLDIDSWENNYYLSLQVYTTRAEVAYLLGDFQEMEVLSQTILSEAQNILDKVAVYKILISASANQRKMIDAITIGKKALKDLGVELPSRPNPEMIDLTLQKISSLLEGKDIEELIDLPVMKDKKAKAIMDLLANLFIAFFQGMPELMPLVGSIMVDLSIRFGNTSASALGYGVYGLVLSNFLGEVDTGFRYGKLAIKVMNKFPEIQFRGLTLNLYGGCIHHHQQASGKVLPLLRSNYLESVKNKDMITAGCILVYGFTSFFAGMELEVLENELTDYDQVLADFKQYSAKVYIDITWQTVKNLREFTDSPDLLVGSAYDEKMMLDKHQRELELTAIAQVYVYKILLAYLFADYNNAQKYINEVKPYLMTIAGTMFFAVYHFYGALTYLALMPDAENAQKILEEVESHQSILKRWADNAPMNYLSKWHLVEAEKQRVLGNKASAIDSYEKAIKLAEQDNYINIRAIANELAGQFYLGWGKKRLAQHYFQESFYNYGLWGATAKISQLEEKYPQFFHLSNLDLEKDSLPSLDSNRQNNLDLVTVMKASQAIAREIVLENLLQTLMKILLENAGAQKGCLLLNNSSHGGENLDNFIIAIYSNNSTVSLYPACNFDEIIPQSLVYYVIRTKESLCLDNPDMTGDFVQDKYIQSVKPSSVICFPLINQGKLLGIIYLENNFTMLTSGMMSRLEVLQLLARQAAIALTNAQLYHQIKENGQLLKQFLEAMPVGVGVLDAKGRPYYANKQAQLILGKGVISNVRKKDIATVYKAYKAGTNELYPNEQLAIIKALRGEVSSDNDVEIHNGNRIIPIESWGTPIYNKSGKVQFAMIAFHDISQLRQAEKVLQEYNQTLEKEVKKRTAELEKANKKLSRLANLDGLTHIPNRRRFDEYLSLEWQRHQRQQQTISLLLIDIDYFKPYNDFYGHQQGDECLIQVAQTIASTLQRPTDLAARYGGEEFVIILPHTSPQGALTVAELVQSAIASLQIPHQKSSVSEYITLSIGIATITPSSEYTPEDLIKTADNCLYQAKENGRNKILLNIIN